jgi:hypothetical protein
MKFFDYRALFSNPFKWVPKQYPKPSSAVCLSNYIAVGFNPRMGEKE